MPIVDLNSLPEETRRELLDAIAKAMKAGAHQFPVLRPIPPFSGPDVFTFPVRKVGPR